MRPRTTLVLLAIAAGLWAAWALWLREVPGTAERREQAQRLLPGLDPAKVRTVRLERDGETVVLERSGTTDWTLTAPIADRAEVAAVESLLRDLAEADAASRVPAAEVAGGATSTGLDRPIRVQLTPAGGAAVRTLEVGTLAIPGGHHYARTADGSAAGAGDAVELALVGRDLVDALARPLEELRAHDLFALAPLDVQRWEIARAAAPPVRFERRAGEEWWLAAPRVDVADGATVAGMLSRVIALRADRLLRPAPPPSTTGLDAPDLTVRLFTKGEAAAATLALGRAVAPGGGRRYGRVDGRDAVFEVEATGLVNELSRDPAALRGRLLLDLSTYDVRTLTLERAGTRVTLDRSEDDKGAITWKPADGTPAVDAKKADTLLAKIVRIEAKRIAADGTPLGPLAARATIARREPSKNPELTIEIGGAAGPGEVYARRIDRPAVLVLDEAIARGIDPAALR